MTITEETFGGLFTEEPMASYDVVICARCDATLRDWQPCAPVGVLGAR